MSTSSRSCLAARPANGLSTSRTAPATSPRARLRRPTAPSRCKIKDFVDLITGKLNGQQAFVQGKLKIQGNMALAMKLSLLSQAPKANL